ncbi:tandem-95 repeat protein [Cupriavidus sp. AcVe19-6a]|uniref:tandem-95 repeat protein n=1 Tax=Cupriavidus sp. AcVe19-6a TaxID=2821358 RepID=UPI001AE8DF8D|nr:cadherin-like domain-containing protein [Cupriavidus sp. AcVe19-6a]MBP0634945.1 tandem-95 repeat protein [Cupriavidus sp. AcVe19-6a]
MPKSISAQSLSEIRFQLNAGKITPSQVYSQLEGHGYRYAGWARGVADANTIAGASALTYMQNTAKELGKPLTGAQVEQIKLDMAKGYLDALYQQTNDGSLPVTRDIDSREVWSFHSKVFEDNGLPPQAWTLDTPFRLMEKMGGPAQVEQFWNMLRDTGGGYVDALAANTATLAFMYGASTSSNPSVRAMANDWLQKAPGVSSGKELLNLVDAIAGIDKAGFFESMGVDAANALRETGSHVQDQFKQLLDKLPFSDASGITGVGNALARLGGERVSLADIGGTHSGAGEALAAQQQAFVERAAQWQGTIERLYGKDVSIYTLGDGTRTLVDGQRNVLATVATDDGDVRLIGLHGEVVSVGARGELAVTEPTIGGLPFDGHAMQQEASVTAASESVSPVDTLGSIQSMLSLVQAIESGDTKAIVAASAAMLANLDRTGGGTLLSDGVGVGLNALAAGINLFNAIQDGDGLRIAASSLNLGSQAATIYANMLKDEGIAAYQAGATTAGNSLMESAGTMGQVAGGLALVASIVSLVMAIEDGNGYQIASAALSTAAAGFAVAGYTSYCPPLAFAAVAVAMIGAAFTDDDIPTLEGEATAVWNPDRSIHVLTTVDTEQGGGTPTRMLQSLVDELQKSLSAQVDANGNPVYAIIPQRLPTIGYAYHPDSYLGNVASFDGAPGHLYLKWIDENGREQTRYFDGAGNRGQAGQATLMQEFLVHAFEAVVPAWEAETILAAMNETDALTWPASGSVDENRARVAQQLSNQEWQSPAAEAGMPEQDADGIRQHFTALTVEIELPPGVGTGRIGKNVDLDGYIEQTDWVQANQGILSIDVNGDGIIGQSEILTNDPDAAAANARNSLQWLDINHDGKLDASDPAFAALGIWLDVNRNGQTDDGEFASLLDKGIACLDFTSQPPVLHAADGTVVNVTEQHLTADVRGDYYQAAFADTDGNGDPDAFAGMLHAKEGGETVLNAVVTHDYTGEAGHTHGGLAGADASGEARLGAGDERVHTASDRQHEQVLAEDVIAAGDIRVSDGEAMADGATTVTTVEAGDGRLASKGDTNGGKGSPRTDTVRPNDGRVTSAAPTNPADAYAAIRDEWIKSADSPFAGAGALTGVAVGAVAGVASAQTGTDTLTSDTGILDTTGNNTVSRVSGPTEGTDAPSTTTTQPPFVPSPVIALPPVQRHGGANLDKVLTVDVTPSQIQTVAHDGTLDGATSGMSTTSPVSERTITGPNGEDARLAFPDVQDESVAAVEDTRYAFDAAVLLANDTTKNAIRRPLQLTEVFGAEHGTVSMVTQPDGSQRIVFTPDPDYWGPAIFRYTVSDEYGMAAVGNVRFDIAPVNDVPVTAGETAAMDEDTGILFTSAQLLANDFDVDTPTVGDVLVILRVSDAQHGLVKLDADGNVRFLPDHDYFGPASFVYWVSDGNGGLTPATVNIEVRPVNDAPVATGETVTTDEDTILLIEQATLLANETDVDNPHSDLTVFSVRNGQHGTVELTPEGQIRFVPEQDFYGTATFFYTVYDGAGGYIEAMATVDLAPVNDAPIVTGEDFSGTEDETGIFTAASLLANDRDVDDAQSSLTLVAVGNAVHGEVRLNADGSVSFIPEADYFGAASFDYTVADPHGATTTGRVDIELAPVNDAPRLRGDVIDGTEDTALTIDAAVLLANDADVDNEHHELTITRVGSATHGTVSLNPDGTIRFVPNQDFFGDASFQYEVSDGAGGFLTATATIHVAPVNDVPIANDNLVAGRKGVAITLTSAALLADDFDIDNPHNDLRIVGVSGAKHGTVRLNADGSVTFLPDPGYGGYPGAHGQFIYTISDGAGGFATATTTVNLERINTTPVAVDDGFSGYENTPFIINTAQFLANDSDPDGDALTVTQVANAQHGTVEIQADGQVRFTPDHDFYGQASFQYLVSDSYGGQTWSTAFLNIEHVNKAPVIEAIEFGRPVFGYYYGPAPQVGTAAPVDGGGPLWAAYDENHERATNYFQPLYDEGLARSLSAQGKLYDAGGVRYTPALYQNGMLKPLELSPVDSYTQLNFGGVDMDVYVGPADDPARQMGRIVVYDPDGNSAAVVISILHGPQHGHAYANAYVDTFTPEYEGHTWLAQHLINTPSYWQYLSHRGDPYNGADSFTIRITDAQGAVTDVEISTSHKGTNASGGFTPIVLDLNGNGTELLAADQSAIRADVNDDGQIEQIGWAANTDGVLGFDADGDGRISVEETRLTNFAPDAKTDVEALAAFDSNHDGKISQEDAAWSRFQVVQDANGDGDVTQAEHKLLDELGIASISLQRQGEAHLDHGNVVFGTVEVTHTDGTKSEAADVMFAGKDVPLPSFAAYLEEVHTGIEPAAPTDDAAFAANAVAQLISAATEPPGCPYPPGSLEEAQWSRNLWAQLLATADGPPPSGGFVPPHEDTLADMIDRTAQASVVDLGMGNL